MFVKIKAKYRRVLIFLAVVLSGYGLGNIAKYLVTIYSTANIAPRHTNNLVQETSDQRFRLEQIEAMEASMDRGKTDILYELSFLELVRELSERGSRLEVNELIEFLDLMEPPMERMFLAAMSERQPVKLLDCLSYGVLDVDNALVESALVEVDPLYAIDWLEKYSWTEEDADHRLGTVMESWIARDRGLAINFVIEGLKNNNADSKYLAAALTSESLQYGRVAGVAMLDQVLNSLGDDSRASGLRDEGIRVVESTPTEVLILR